MNHFCSDQFEAYSAGVKQTSVHKLAIQVMKEIDIDISHQRSKLVNEFKDTTFEYVVTVCDHAKETCPFFPGKQVLHKGFTDPGTILGTKEKQLNEFRKIRDEIKQWILDFFCSPGQIRQKDVDAHV